MHQAKLMWAALKYVPRSKGRINYRGDDQTTLDQSGDGARERGEGNFSCLSVVGNSSQCQPRAWAVQPEVRGYQDVLISTTGYEAITVSFAFDPRYKYMFETLWLCCQRKYRHVANRAKMAQLDSTHDRRLRTHSTRGAVHVTPVHAQQAGQGICMPMPMPMHTMAGDTITIAENDVRPPNQVPPLPVLLLLPGIKGPSCICKAKPAPAQPGLPRLKRAFIAQHSDYNL